MTTSSDARWRLGANTTTSPVVIDDDGHQVGGGEYAPVDTTQQAVTDAVARGALVYPDLPTRTSKTAAGHALREVERLNTPVKSDAKEA